MVRRVISAIALSALAAGGCRPTRESDAPAHVMSDFPAWTGREQSLYDDGIDPGAVGVTMDPPPTRFDIMLRDRARTGDLVAVVRVETVTVETVGEEKRYHIGLSLAEPPLADPKITDQTMDILVVPTMRAWGIVKSLDVGLSGKRFTGFFRRFAGELGEPVVHWHLSSASKETVDLVREAALLRSLSRR